MYILKKETSCPTCGTKQVKYLEWAGISDENTLTNEYEFVMETTESFEFTKNRKEALVLKRSEAALLKEDIADKFDEHLKMVFVLGMV